MQPFTAQYTDFVGVYERAWHTEISLSFSPICLHFLPSSFIVFMLNVRFFFSISVVLYGKFKSKRNNGSEGLPSNGIFLLQFFFITTIVAAAFARTLASSSAQLQLLMHCDLRFEQRFLSLVSILLSLFNSFAASAAAAAASVCFCPGCSPFICCSHGRCRSYLKRIAKCFIA